MEEKERYEFGQRTLFDGGEEVTTFDGFNLDDFMQIICNLLNQQSNRIKELEEQMEEKKKEIAVFKRIGEKGHLNDLLEDQIKVNRILIKGAEQLLLLQNQKAIEQLEKIRRHFVYTGNEIVSDYGLDCEVDELKEEIDNQIKELTKNYENNT